MTTQLDTLHARAAALREQLPTLPAAQQAEAAALLAELNLRIVAARRATAEAEQALARLERVAGGEEALSGLGGEQWRERVQN